VNVRKKEPEEINMMAVFPVILASCHWPVYHQKVLQSDYKPLLFLVPKIRFEKQTQHNLIRSGLVKTYCREEFKTAFFTFLVQKTS
jgi:hypothetical protein